MNILILNWRDPKNPKAGGAEYVTLEHAKAWVKRGHNVTWFSTNFPKAKVQEILDGITIRRRGNQLTVFFHAYRFYKKSRNDFSIVIDEIHGLPFLTPLYVKVPVIAFIHEVAVEIWDYMYPFPVSKLGKFLEKKLLSFYKSVPFWTDASSTIDDLEDIGIDRRHVKVIPCPISNKSLRDLPKKEAKPTFIFVSRLVPMKGVEDVIRAFQFILKKEKDAQLWIVGEGSKEYLEKLKKIVNKMRLTTEVHFYGFVSGERKLELMRRAHLLLHGSIKEGWGLVVLEAASQATPSVAYNVSGLRDTIHDGKTGVLVKKGDPLFLANASLALLENKKKYMTMQEACLTWASSLRWEDVERESLLLLEEVTAKKRNE